MQLQNKEFIISKLINSENSLIELAKELCCTLGSASIDIAALHKQIDDKNLLEAQNHELVLTFGSQLDKSLQNLHETIFKSISQQKNQLICMEDHLCSCLAIKDDATKNLESTVQKIAEIHASTITALEDFNSSLLSKTSADFENINSSISSEVHEMEKLLNSLVIEAKDVIYQIQCSLSQQKELLIFSTQQQEQGLQGTLVSAQSITKATQGFFDEICAHASKVMSDLEECQTRNLNYLKNFEKTFEEQSALEEQQAMEKIVSAMATLRTNKTALVSQALSRINETGEEDTKACHQNLSKILQASVAAKNGLDGHVENIEGQYSTDLYMLTEINGSMKDQIKQCSNQADSSTEQWKRAAQSVKKLHGESKLSIQSTINIYQNEIAQSQCLKTSSVKKAEFDANQT